MGNIVVVLTVAVVAGVVGGTHITHLEPAANKKGLSSGQLVLNTTKLTGDQSQRPIDHAVNWTRIEQDQSMQKRAKSLAKQWLGDPKPNSTIFERQIVRKVYSRPMIIGKVYTTDPSEGKPFAYSNIQANQNWTAFDYAKVQTTNDQLFKSSNGTVTCPKERPFYNGESCVECDTGGFFDVDAKQCGWPTPSKQFDPNLHRFVQPQPKMKTRMDAPYLEYGGISKSEYQLLRQKEGNSPFQECPVDAPYYDNVACIPCVMPFPIFNVETKRCDRCQPGHLYQQEHHGCYLPGGARQPFSIRQSLGSIIG